jgi:hypothetical protein
MDRARAAPPARDARELEEREDAPRRADLVAVVEVVDVRGVEVDGLLSRAADP